MLAHLGGGSGQQLAGHPAVSAAAVAQRSLQAQVSFVKGFGISRKRAWTVQRNLHSWNDVFNVADALASFSICPTQASEMPFPSNSTPKQRVFSCTRRDTLRSVVEKLSIPGVRRLVVVRPEESNVVEGVLSLCDVAAFLLSI